MTKTCYVIYNYLTFAIKVIILKFTVRIRVRVKKSKVEMAAFHSVDSIQQCVTLLVV